MINTFFLRLYLVFVTFLVVLSCSTEEDTILTDNSTEIKQIIDAAKSGTWRITNYVDSGKDETNDFTGYNFTFSDNGTLTASNSSTAIDGNWSVIDDSSDDGDDIDFNIFFSAPPNFEDLSDDWDIVSSSGTKIELIDISGGNGDTDLLTFEIN